MAESTVRAKVAEIKSELDGWLRNVTILQVHGPGEEAEVDLAELSATVAGVGMRLWMFAMRLSHSGRAFHVIFAHQAQEAFFEGHVLAFAHFGCVPARARCDNLKNAVTRVLIGRDRVENERFVALRSHYGPGSLCCEPGQKGAHEKGGVEGEVGRFAPGPSRGCARRRRPRRAQPAVRRGRRRRRRPAYRPSRRAGG